MKYYFDTSALLKIYHSESGTLDVLGIYENTENRVLISELSCTEFLSTVYRKYREKEITADTRDAVVAKFHDDTDSRYEILRFTSLVTDEAERLIRRFADENSLKTLDSIQFAFFCLYCENDTVFVCSDRKLSKLVSHEGFRVLML